MKTIFLNIPKYVNHASSQLHFAPVTYFLSLPCFDGPMSVLSLICDTLYFSTSYSDGQNKSPRANYFTDI